MPGSRSPGLHPPTGLDAQVEGRHASTAPAAAARPPGDLLGPPTARSGPLALLAWIIRPSCGGS